MRLVSFSEYELGVIAVGGTPTGIIALGLMPVGVIAIGTLPFGVISLACGGGLGLVNLTCGIGVGAYVRGTGLTLGGDAEAVGLALPLAGKRGEGAAWWYWLRVGLVAAAVIVVLGLLVDRRLVLAGMDRVVDAEWSARPETTEGIYLDPGTACTVSARMRSDGERHLHALVWVQCSSLELAARDIRGDCDVRQQRRDEQHVYDLACFAEHVPEQSDEDGTTPEQPGMELYTFGEGGGRVRVWADGPPPMNVVLTVDSPSVPVAGEPLLLDRRTELDGREP